MLARLIGDVSTAIYMFPKAHPARYSILRVYIGHNWVTSSAKVKVKAFDAQIRSEPFPKYLRKKTVSKMRIPTQPLLTAHSMKANAGNGIK
jgi:hypothetical protein